MTVKAPRRGVGYFEENLRQFSETVAAAKKRTTSFAGPTADLAQEPAMLREALDELRVHQEELAVEGVGIGLYIVQQFASAPKDAQANRALLAAHAGGAEAAPSSRRPPPIVLEGVRVLVVEDEEDARELMAAILRNQGAAVTVAGDVPSALEAFDAAPPDVVLSDIALPGRSGLDLARDLRSRGRLDATLVAVSGYAAADQIDRALTAGFDVHMAKPVDPAELVEVIRDAARLRMQ